MPVRTNGAEVRRRRELQGLTVTEFARQAGYSLNHVSQVELGRLPGGPRFRRAAAQLLGCAVADITEETAPAADAGTASTAGRS